VTTATTAPKPSKDHQPGRPTDLPVPPGHSR
jgi:hypothetical protein